MASPPDLAVKLAAERSKYKHAQDVIKHGGPTMKAVNHAHKVVDKFEHDHPEMVSKSPRNKR